MFRPNWPSSGVYWVRLLLLLQFGYSLLSALGLVCTWFVVYGFVCGFPVYSCCVAIVLFVPIKELLFKYYLYLDGIITPKSKLHSATGCKSITLLAYTINQ
jgi:hypothetical protein